MVSGVSNYRREPAPPALQLRARRGACFSPRMNHALVFEALAAAYPDRECIVTPTRRLSYAQVADHMRRLASVLHANRLGCRRERAELANHESGQDHVGLYLLNCPEYIEGMLGCYRARSAPFNVNYRYVDDELCYLFDDADAVAVVYHARYAPTLARIRARLPKLRLLLQVDDGSGERLLPGALDYAAALAAASPAGPPVRPTPDDLYIIYTGGTTGAPKGVLWRQEDIFHAAMSGGPPGFDGPTTIADLVAEAEHGTYMRTLPVPPLMHGAAQWVAFGAIHKGGTVVLQGNPEKLDPEDVWGTAERERVSTIAIVGDAFARPLLDGLDQRQYDLSRLFIVGSGGAILSPHNKQAFLERLPHVTVVDGFGASETGAQGSHASRGGDAVNTGTFSVVGGTRYAVPGDHARLLADGTIVVLGRGSVSINTGGEKFYAEEVEQVLRRHPAVYDAVVVGTPDARFGERVTAVVQLRSGAQPSAEELVAFAAQHLARYKLPKTTVLVDEMVRSPSGKPDYRWARARALEARGLPAG